MMSEVVDRLDQARRGMAAAAAELAGTADTAEAYQVFIEVRKYRGREGKRRPEKVWGSGLREARFTKSMLDKGMVDYQLDVRAIIAEMEEDYECRA